MPKHTIEDIRREYARLDAITGIDSSTIPIIISTRAKRRYGCCLYNAIKHGSRRHYIVLELNFSDFIFEWPQEFFMQTIRHEYAHMLAITRNPHEKVGHGPKWEAACLEIGCKPERCSVIPPEYKKQPKYLVRCVSCGRTWRYHKKAKLVQNILDGKPSEYICACGCKEFSLSEPNGGE